MPIVTPLTTEGLNVIWYKSDRRLLKNKIKYAKYSLFYASHDATRHGKLWLASV